VTAPDRAATDPTFARQPVWRHWPSVVGLLVACWQISVGVDTDGTSITVAAAASCYLAAAALNLRWIAWAGIIVSGLAVTLTELAGVPWWWDLAAYVVVLVMVGLVRASPCRMLSEQSLAMVGFGGLAVLALFLSPRVGLALAGLVLVSHALWDYRHWRRNDVVPRSMAELCIVLDVPLGAAALFLAVAG
jgi:hypothetical protein